MTEPSATLLHEVFTAQAARTPDAVAVTAADGILTYRALDEASTALADRLRAVGVGPETLVGLCAPRGAELVVGLLGICKAGGAYVPIDPDYPEQRVRYLFQDSAVPVVVASTRSAGALPADLSAGVVWLGGSADRDPAAGSAASTPAAPAGADRAAYVIYTSGSTGEPKGVVVEHRSVLRLVAQTREWFGFGEDDVWTMFHSPSFDFSVWETWGPLLTGGRVVVVPPNTTRVPALLRRLLLAERVTVLNQTPSAFRALIAADAVEEPARYALRHVVFGGERLDVGLLRPWVERYGDDRPRLTNMYGITETCVHVTRRRITAADLERPSVSPIGCPIPDLVVHVLDERRQPVPVGTPGVLHVGGPGLARGYLGRPGLTAERFVRVDPGAGRPVLRLYDTGDLGVRQAGGELHYLGRVDDQLKVRGYRIEPGEVEACLLAHPRVAAAVVTARDFGEGDVRLVAHVVPAAGAAGHDLVAALRDHVAERLPAHLRPSTVCPVAALPVTPQGKVNRKAVNDLPLTEENPPAAEADVVTAVTEIAAGVMGRPVDPAVDLFDIGATSLSFVRIITGVNLRFGLRLTGGELDGTASALAIAEQVELARAATTEHATA
ncbi:amino acid adenylation domain-containing protein [Saccharothrix longispora]|uniref:amino acid adenylation domain-containing protein n=1 Tax=Saccharothrix longispora TaxID=33920 RepID=UPI0028FD0061|nr:amino acid adenylation domain-containing protein [Saccharothrix longispora]MBY8849640.1 amino acid adenylation domain-containing protein [Saccharothrix sp. MB29]MDU0293311.1 amino acid adenylation domain-containing protein [Saccharothrix longispora]